MAKTKKEDDTLNYKNFLKFCAGSFILILGMTLVLSWWPDVVALVRGMLGIILAVAGMLILYSLSK